MTEQLIGDIAVEAIDKIMDREGIRKIRVGYDVKSDAKFSEVMQYIWSYTGKGAITERRPEGHRYRTNLYRGAINQAQIDSSHIQHIDIGCGGGTFTWSLLEWCLLEGIDLNKVRLHSYDYSRKMVVAAKWIHRFIRKRCRKKKKNIPKLHAYSKYRKLLKAISTNPKAPTHYLITAGYVIAHNLDEQMIKDFTEIITTVVGKAGNNPCSLIVCDASQTAELGPPYKQLVASLEDNGVRVKTRRTNDRMRIARLRLEGV